MFQSAPLARLQNHGRSASLCGFGLVLLLLCLIPGPAQSQTALKFVEPSRPAGKNSDLLLQADEPRGIPAAVEPAEGSNVKIRLTSPEPEPEADDSAAESLNGTPDPTQPDPALPDPTQPDLALPDMTQDKADAEPMQAEPAGVGDVPTTDTATGTEGTHYDPIKENGEFFVGWEKPEAALVVTGLLDGYIEPCGCAGMDRMKGGLSRRYTFLEELRNRDWPVLALDAGQICNGFGVQEELKFDMAMNGFRLMDYQAIGVGRGELRFPAYFLLTFTAPPSVSDQSRFVSANVGIYSFNKLYLLPYKIVWAGEQRIGVTSVVFPTDELSHRDSNILIENPSKKLREIVPQLVAEKTAHNVLIVHGTEAEALALAAEFPQFDLLISGDSPSEPPATPKEIGKGQFLLEPGEKGKFAIVLGLYNDPSNPVRYQRVALDSRYAASDEIYHLMEEYQGILKTLITTKGYKGGLGLSLVESEKRHVLGDYVGSAECESCHEESYRTWLRSKHAVAWNSLTQTAKPPRDFDPECISCHVVGWHGIENFPYVGGFVTEEQTPHLRQVGCETCHGPGSKHIEAELGDNEQLQESIRGAMRLGDDVRKVCYSCHDGDNSPDFDFDPYYKQIEHHDSP